MSGTEPGGRASALIVALIAGVIGLASVLLLVIVWRGPARAPAPGAERDEGSSIPPEALAVMVIPEFELVNQDGERVTRQDVFSGRMTLLAFSFTNCPMVCPMMHSHLVQLTHETLRGAPVQIVTISVDPEHDTPEALREHAAKLGVADARWTMLTGEEATIRNIVSSMKFAIADDPSLPITLKDGGTMMNIVHPTKLVLVGPQGTVLDLDSGLEFESANRLAMRARDLAVRLGLK